MILTGLRTLLLAEATITDLVGARGVYVNQAGQAAATPYAVLTTTAVDPMLTLDGAGGMRSTSIDVDCYGDGYLAAKSLADAITACLADYRGPAGAGESIDAVLWQGERDAPAPPTDGKQTGRHLVTVEFEIQHTPG